MCVEDLPALSYRCVRATSSPRWMSRISRPGIAEPLLCKGSYPQQGEMIYGRIASAPYLLKDIDKVHPKISGFTLFYCRNNKKLAAKILLSKDRSSLVANLIRKEHHFYLTTSLEHWFIRY